MSFCSEGQMGGQATVEAAFLIPVILLLMALLVQPVIVLFDRAVMEAAASEGVRVLETLSPGDERAACAAVERRLSAVPDIGVFHEGPWLVEIVGGEGQTNACVSVEHEIRPLPFMGIGMELLGMTNDRGLIEQEVSKDAKVTEDWVAESRFGSDAEAWLRRWEEKA